MGTKSREEVEREDRDENIVDTISTASGAAEPEARLEVDGLISAVKKFFYILDTSFNDLNDEYELETGSTLTGKSI